MSFAAFGALAIGIAVLAAAFGYAYARKGARSKPSDGTQSAESRNTTMKRAVNEMAHALVVVDGTMRVHTWNQYFLDLFDLPESRIGQETDLIGLMGEVFHKQKDHVISILNAAQKTSPCEQLPDGRWIEFRARHLGQDRSLVTLTDITERESDLKDLRISEERHALATKGSYDAIWDWDLRKDTVYYSPSWQEMLGLKEGMAQNTPGDWFDRVHPRDLDELQGALKNHLDGHSDRFKAEFRMLHFNDDFLWVYARGSAVRDDHGKPVRIVGTMRDISERKRSEEKLIHDALYDSVTGLPNRALFLDRISQVMARQDKGGQTKNYAVLFLDLDRFKVINDSLGHDVGDELLIDVARRLESAIKPGDSLARLASDEFGILLTGIEDGDDAIETVHWLQSDLAAAFYLRDQEIFTSVCIGIALPSTEFRTSEDMLRAADIAMYRAKDQGQSSYAVFDSAMQTRAITQLQLESDLRKAVERDELVVYYQPIISFKSGRIAGFETLARWQHPERGLIAPGEFIPLAEDTGLIVPIGAQALRKSCRRMKQWIDDLGDKAPDSISVNLSSRQLQDPDLVREIELLLAQTGLPGSRLKLEVTESMIMHNPESTARTLMELKDLGVTLSIDDFGTGYSSLSYLHRFPFDTLKIDRSFIVSMEDKRENMEIIRTITVLAHSLGMDVIAEGIETPAHLKRLLELGCEFGQGFFFSRPEDEDYAEGLLRENKSWDIKEIVESNDHAAE